VSHSEKQFRVEGKKRNSLTSTSFGNMVCRYIETCFSYLPQCTFDIDIVVDRIPNVLKNWGNPLIVHQI